MSSSEQRPEILHLLMLPACLTGPLLCISLADWGVLRPAWINFVQQAWPGAAVSAFHELSEDCGLSHVPCSPCSLTVPTGNQRVDTLLIARCESLCAQLPYWKSFHSMGYAHLGNFKHFSSITDGFVWQIVGIHWSLKSSHYPNKSVHTYCGLFFHCIVYSRIALCSWKHWGFNVVVSLQHKRAALHCTVVSNIFFSLFFVFGCVYLFIFFFFEHSFPSVLPLLSACLMYQSFRWGVTGMALSFRSEELSVFQLLRQV